jgi:hypothetical protein
MSNLPLFVPELPPALMNTVHDCAVDQGVRAAMRHIEKGLSAGIINIETGAPWTLSDIATACDTDSTYLNKVWSVYSPSPQPSTSRKQNARNENISTRRKYLLNIAAFIKFFRCIVSRCEPGAVDQILPNSADLEVSVLHGLYAGAAPVYEKARHLTLEGTSLDPTVLGELRKTPPLHHWEVDMLRVVWRFAPNALGGKDAFSFELPTPLLSCPSPELSKIELRRFFTNFAARYPELAAALVANAPSSLPPEVESLLRRFLVIIGELQVYLDVLLFPSVWSSIVNLLAIWKSSSPGTTSESVVQDSAEDLGNVSSRDAQGRPLSKKRRPNRKRA